MERYMVLQPRVDYDPGNSLQQILDRRAGRDGWLLHSASHTLMGWVIILKKVID